MAKTTKKSGDSKSTPKTKKTTRTKKGETSAAEARVNAANPATVEAAVSGQAVTSENVAPADTMSAPANQAPTDEAIRRRAYEIYLERGGAPGNPLEDWARAERELRGE